MSHTDFASPINTIITKIILHTYLKEGYIREWNEFVPWKDMLMVEQDLIICRALVSIFNDDFLRMVYEE